MDLLTLMFQPFSFELLKSKQGREILKTHTHVCALKTRSLLIMLRALQLNGISCSPLRVELRFKYLHYCNHQIFREREREREREN